MRRRSVVVLSAGAAGAVLAAGTTGTYALFSDFATVQANKVAAATVVLGSAATEPPALTYTGLGPGETLQGTLTVDYRGTIPADVSLQVSADGPSALCIDRSGSWAPLPGGEVFLDVGSDSFSYCALLNGMTIPLGTLDPGSSLPVDVDVRLTVGADQRYSELTENDVLTVRAAQSGVGAFTDAAVGTISISTDRITPPVPAECAATAFKADNVIVLEPDQHVYEAPQSPDPYLIFGTEGDDAITGSNKGDCLVGGGGKDVLTGGNGQDVLLGAAGDDALHSGTGKDELFGGDGNDALFGEGAPDDVFGGTGDDTLDGGGGPDLLDAGAGVDSCDGGTGSDGKETFVGCEAQVPAPESSAAVIAPPPAAAKQVAPPVAPAPAPAPAPASPPIAPTPAPVEEAPPPPVQPEPDPPPPSSEPGEEEKAPPAGEPAPTA